MIQSADALEREGEPGHCPHAQSTYLKEVASFFLRLLAMAAIILMPVGMGVTPAAAAMPSSHARMSGQEEGHCGQKPDEDAGKAVAMQCAGSCSALPAELSNLGAEEPAPVPSLSAGVVKVLNGVTLPLSTPPPRVA